MKNSKIRPAQSKDVPRIKMIADATDLFPSTLLDAMISGYLSGSRPDLWFVYIENEEPVSFGFCEPERMTEGTWNLLAVGVSPDCQGSGIGSAMMSYLEEALAEHGARVLLVETSGTADFERTRKFYRKVGYTEEARIREFYEKGADKVIFWKQL